VLPNTRCDEKYYSASIADFLTTTANEILGQLRRSNPFTLEQTQRNAWLEEIRILQQVLTSREGRIYFEYAIPRMGKCIDVVLLIGPVIFVLEFKLGERDFTPTALDQVCDYALDLKNFHESSYDRFIAPVLIATAAQHVTPIVCATPQNDKLLSPIRCTAALLVEAIDECLRFAEGAANIDPENWERGRRRASSRRGPRIPRCPDSISVKP
jgi:hypothetical protein